MVNEPGRKSQIYGAIQTALLIVFAAVFVFDLGPRLFVSERLHIFGKVLCWIGIVFMLIAMVSLRKVIQIAPAPREGGHLVTSGVYRWFRHPIYSAILLLVVGLFLTKPTLGSAITGAAVIAFLLIKARLEETLLVARYPDYADYRKRAWGVIPGFRG